MQHKTHPEITKRLQRAGGHLRKIICMMGEGRPCVELVYRTRFFGHKFELSGLLHSGFLPGDTCVVRTA